MGRITEYTRQQLASQAVGVPQADQSGQIIAEGIQKGVQGVAKIIGEREQNRRDLDKTLALGEFGVKAAEIAEQTHRTYRDDPLKAPEAIRTETGKLIEDMASKMDPQTGTLFRNDASQAMLAQQKTHLAKAYDQDTRNTVGKIQSLYIESALLGEGIHSAEGLAALKKRFDIIDQKASKWMDPGTVSSMRATYWPQAVKASIDSRAIVEPNKLLADLARPDSPYAKENGGALSPTQMKQASALAKQQAAFAQSINSIKYLSTAVGEISELDDRADAGQLSLSELNRRIDWAESRVGTRDEVGAEVVSPEHLEGLKQIRNKMLAFGEEVAPKEREKISQATLATLQAEWQEYMRGEDQESNKMNKEDYRKVLQFYNKTLAAKNAGVLSEAQFQQMKFTMDKRVKGAISKGYSSATFTDAIQKASKTGWFGWGEDLYTRGYKRIEQDIDKMDISPDKKFDLKAEYMASFTRAVDTLSPEQKAKLEKDKAGQLAMIDEIWVGNPKKGSVGIRGTLYKKPGYTVKHGVMLEYVIGEDNQPYYTLPANIQKALANR